MPCRRIDLDAPNIAANARRVVDATAERADDRRAARLGAARRHARRIAIIFASLLSAIISLGLSVP